MHRSLWSSPWSTLLALAVLASGCTVNSNIMFKTPNDYQFDTFVDSVRGQFRIQPNDALELRIFANDGYKMIDLVSERATRDMMMINRMAFTYNVEFDGLVKLPLLGRVPLAGMNMREAEMYLEERFSEFYNRPFVQIQVMNRRAIIFNGSPSAARSVNLENNNTTLIEALALAGGISTRGKAKKVKLFRRDPDGGPRKVYEFDLSTIEGIQYADIVMEGDDIVYVQPNLELAREALRDLTPIVSLLTTTILILGLVNRYR